jgi:hypothetical protein
VRDSYASPRATLRLRVAPSGKSIHLFVGRKSQKRTDRALVVVVVLYNLGLCVLINEGIKKAAEQTVLGEDNLARYLLRRFLAIETTCTRDKFNLNVTLDS